VLKPVETALMQLRWTWTRNNIKLWLEVYSCFRSDKTLENVVFRRFLDNKTSTPPQFSPAELVLVGAKD